MRLLSPLLLTAMLAAPPSVRLKEGGAKAWSISIVESTLTVLAVIFAWYLQMIISAFYSGLRGGRMFSDAFINILHENDLMRFLPCIHRSRSTGRSASTVMATRSPRSAWLPDPVGLHPLPLHHLLPVDDHRVVLADADLDERIAIEDDGGRILSALSVLCFRGACWCACPACLSLLSFLVVTSLAARGGSVQRPAQMRKRSLLGEHIDRSGPLRPSAGLGGARGGDLEASSCKARRRGHPQLGRECWIYRTGR